MGHIWRFDKSASCYFISFHEKMPIQKQKPWMLLGKKRQVVHDHYSLGNLKTTGSSMEVQLFRVCLLGNADNPMSFASWSSTLTISMLRLPKVSTISTITSSSSPWRVSGLIKPAKRNEELSGGMSSFGLSSYFPRKLAILFYLFSSRNLCLSCLLDRKSVV